MKDESTFQDILLELMVLNETADKIVKNTADLAGAIRPSGTVPEAGTTVIPAAGLLNREEDRRAERLEVEQGPGSVESCCNEILKNVVTCVAGLSYVGSQLEASNKTLAQIRNGIYRLREELIGQAAEKARLADLAAQQASEAAAEKRAAPTGERRKIPLFDNRMLGILGSDVSSVAKTVGGGLLLAGDAMVGFLKEFAKSFEFPTFEKWFSSLRETVSGFVTKAKSLATSAFEGVEGWLKGLGESFGETKLGKFLQEFKSEAKASQLFQDIKVAFSYISDIAKSWGEGLKDIGKTMLEGGKEIKTGIMEGLEKMVVAFKESKLFGVISEIGSKIGTWFAETGKIISEMFEPFKSLFGASKELGALEESASLFGKLGKFLGPLAEGLGKLAGKLAMPVTVLMGIYDAVTGFTDAFDKSKGGTLEKVLAGLEGGFTKLIDGLIGWAVDIPKSIISWVAGALGFKEFEKELDKQNFKDTILIPFTKWVGDLIANVIEWIQEKVVGGIKSLFRFGEKKTPDLAPTAEKVRDPKVLNKAADDQLNPDLPQTVKDKSRELVTTKYGFTNDELNQLVEKKSAERIASPQKDVQTANNTGATMTAYQADTQQAKDAAAQTVVVSAGGAPAAAPSNNSSVNSVTYNNTALPDRTLRYVMPALGY